MPVEADDRIIMPILTTNENMDSYTVTATPGSEWFAIINNNINNNAAGRGETLTFNVTPEITSTEGGDPYKLFQFKIVAADEVDEEESVSWSSFFAQVTGPAGEE